MYDHIDIDTVGSTNVGINTNTTIDQNPQIDLSEADGNWNGTINTPDMVNTELTAMYWNGTDWSQLDKSSSQADWGKWYNYSKQQWANAKSADGSMWVWIPRYEYKINSSTHEIYINFKKIGDKTTNGYILHPAFTTDIDNGGWDSELPGFWVAKYAAGYQNSTVGETTNIIQYSDIKYSSVGSGINTNFLGSITVNKTKISYPVFKANTYAYNIISVGDAYLLSQKISNASMYGLKNVDSHLEKNSEWGAVAYLTQSKNGRNGEKIPINNKNMNNSVYVNNKIFGKKANVYAVTSYGNKNIANDVTASSTNNMTGVFDLNGCIWENVAGFIKNGNAKNKAYYNGMVNSNTMSSTKYVTIYIENNKKGDATNETSDWNSGYYEFANQEYPIFYRGGCYSNGENANMFDFSYGYGNAGSYYGGFRVCLISK